MHRSLLVLIILASVVLAVGLPSARAQDSMLVGRVTDQDGQPVPGATVYVEQWATEPGPLPPETDPDGVKQDGQTASSPPLDDPARGSNLTRTDDDGRFSVHVGAGEIYLSIAKPGHESAWASLRVEAGATLTHDVVLLKYPEKTARIEGRAVDEAGEPVRLISVTVQSPAFGIHECSYSDAAGQTDPPILADQEGAGEGSAGSGADASMADAIWEGPYGCSIKILDDGSFEGLVTPGYSIVSVHFDHWRTCDVKLLATDMSIQACGRERYPSIQSLVLPAGQATRIEAVLPAKPGPDAVLQGYVLAGGQPVPGAHVQVSHLDTYAWGAGVTDGDGSFRLAVRSGMLHVMVYAEGYFHWEGTVDVAGTQTIVVDMVAGEDSATCCYGWNWRAVGASEGPSAPSADDLAGEDGDASAGAVFEDLGGGLGPYQPAGGSEDTPALPMLAVLGLLAVVAARRR